MRPATLARLMVVRAQSVRTIHRNDPAQQPAEQIGPGDDAFLLAPDQN